MNADLKRRCATTMSAMRIALILALIIIIGVIAVADPGFIRPDNLLTVTADTMTLFLMASGVDTW